MVEKIILSPVRVRSINGSFAFIEHRFLHDGFFDALSHHELLLYLFLVLAGDRNGVSFYCHDRICAHLRIGVDTYIQARDALIQKDLLAFDGSLFQVLSLPKNPCIGTSANTRQQDPAAVHCIIQQSLFGGSHD
jgi:hypothetical protein